MTSVKAKQAPDFSRIPPHLRYDQGRYRCRFERWLLASAFQPIISLAHQKVVGFEALLRVEESGRQQGPQMLFEHLQGLSDKLTLLDNLSRLLHLANYPFTRFNNHWLFLNINSDTLIGSSEQVLLSPEVLGWFNPQQIVLEILEHAVDNRATLKTFVQQQRRAGFLIAVDDFGAGHSNFDRIWSIQPDIVKIDRNMIVAAEGDVKVRRMLPRMVSLLKECGAVVLVEGVENPLQAAIARDSDVDLIQGFYLGRPNAHWPCHQQLEKNLSAIEEMTGDIAMSASDGLSPLMDDFRHSALQLIAGAELKIAFASCGHQDKLLRAYLLDEQGVQIVDNLVFDKITTNKQRFKPLLGARGTCWSRKPYFRQAMARARQVHVSSPYLSLPDGHNCITLSYAFDTANGRRVVCLDIDDR